MPRPRCSSFLGMVPNRSHQRLSTRSTVQSILASSSRDQILVAVSSFQTSWWISEDTDDICCWPNRLGRRECFGASHFWSVLASIGGNADFPTPEEPLTNTVLVAWPVISTFLTNASLIKSKMVFWYAVRQMVPSTPITNCRRAHKAKRCWYGTIPVWLHMVCTHISGAIPSFVGWGKACPGRQRTRRLTHAHSKIRFGKMEKIVRKKKNTKLGKLDLHGLTLTSTYMDLQTWRYVQSTYIGRLVIVNVVFRGGFKGLQEASKASSDGTLKYTVNINFSKN